MKTGEWLENKRNSLNLSQKELAQKLNATEYEIRSIEEGNSIGNVSLWERIYSEFNEEIMGFECEDTIKALKKEMETKKDEEVYIHLIMMNDSIIFADYAFEDEMDEGEYSENTKYIIKTSLEEAIKLFEFQNKYA